MGSMIALISKSVFKKSGGDKHALGEVFAIAEYTSSNARLTKSLDDALYLVTVKDDRLWLLAVLRDPKHDGTAWRASPNVQPSVDVTALAPRLKFASGKGIKMEKMGMSLQTPRVLTAADVTLLQGALSPAADDAKQTSGNVLASLLARLLRRTEEEVTSDDAHYAAFHWDDGFWEIYEEDIVWDRPPSDAVDNAFWARADFDLSKSLVRDESFAPKTLGEEHPLTKLVKSQGGGLYGKQLALLDEWEFDLPEVLGRITSGPALLDVAEAVLLRPEPAEEGEVDAEFTDFINALGGADRAQLSQFFQTAQSSRSFGARYVGTGDLLDGVAGYRPIAQWDGGEGQGSTLIVEVLNDEILPIPDGVEQPAPTPPAPAAAAVDHARPIEESADELRTTPLLEHLEGDSQSGYFQALIDALREGDAAVEALSDGAVVYQANMAETQVIRKRYRYAIPILDWAIGRLPETKRADFYYLRGFSLMKLYAFEEGLADIQEFIVLAKRHKKTKYKVANANVDAAVCALWLGKLDIALRLAKAGAKSKKNGRPVAVLGRVLFARGDEDAAFERLEACMKGGYFPFPRKKLLEHPRYQGLLANYRS